MLQLRQVQHAGRELRSKQRSCCMQSPWRQQTAVASACSTVRDESQPSFSGRQSGQGQLLATTGPAPVPQSQASLSSPATQAQSQQAQQRHQWLYMTVAAGLLFSLASGVAPAEALTAHEEPTNALSLPTWAIHVSSVVEWVTAMGLMWKYAEVSGNERWKGMTWGMLPSLGSAMAACTWHFMYNAPELEFMVVLQAALTVIGNCTCWLAAYRIYASTVAEKSA